MSEQQHPVSNKAKPQLGRFWTPPNILSLSRLILALPIAYLIFNRPPPDLLTIGLVFMAIATDWFDGKIARWSRSVSEWGKILDPAADKIGGGIILLSMAASGLLPWWLIILFVVRDLIIFVLWRYMISRTSHLYMSLWPGKLTVGLLALTAFFVLLGVDEGLRQILIWSSASMMVYSLIHYLVLFFLELRALSAEGLGRVQARQGGTS